MEEGSFLEKPPKELGLSNSINCTTLVSEDRAFSPTPPFSLESPL
jgi:hypothetical protein